MEKIFKIEITTREEKLKELQESLEGIGIKGMSILQVSGYGNQKGKTEVYRGNALRVDMIAKIRVEIIATQSQAQEIILLAKSVLNTGKVGDGKIVLLPVENVIRIRTAQEGIEAI
ncbi:P-II family nitrogen regulator [Helicobacter sp. 12S02634-8]|uniref:P-II family nitrogen regulator n=1 Tax=Helicobacter sp. 12S02634-8 TaxID=1476199 RepID=UPI000BA53477|nr:P-II family nitrogen regulator [Helicobacter sp. 12S02634-8]PAF48504.1 P-II family nitrogen regulator [Helicobacter sp. 12S02634-8]